MKDTLVLFMLAITLGAGNAMAQKASIPEPKCFEQSECVSRLTQCVLQSKRPQNNARTFPPSADGKSKERTVESHYLYVIHSYGLEMKTEHICIAYNGQTSQFETRDLRIRDISDMQTVDPNAEEDSERVVRANREDCLISRNAAQEIYPACSE